MSHFIFKVHEAQGRLVHYWAVDAKSKKAAERFFKRHLQTSRNPHYLIKPYKVTCRKGTYASTDKDAESLACAFVEDICMEYKLTPIEICNVQVLMKDVKREDMALGLFKIYKMVVSEDTIETHLKNIKKKISNMPTSLWFRQVLEKKIYKNKS